MSTATITTAGRAAVHTPTRALWRNKAVRTVFYHLMVAGFGFVMLYPILWLFASSLKGAAEIWNNISSLIPREPTLANYVNGWRGFGGITFTTFYINSFIYAGVGTLIVMMTSAVVAYGFARIQFSGRRFWFACMLATLMLPVQVQIIPQYIVFSQLGGIFFRIILPQITPALITAAIFSFYWTWEDFLTPLIYLNAPRLDTVSLALHAFADPSGTTDWGAIFAMSSLSLVPVFAIFVFFQRFLVEGISTTGLRGYHKKIKIAA